MGVILFLSPVPAAPIIHPDCELKTMSTFHSSLWGNKHGDPRFFSQVFAKNSLINNIFEEEKSLIVEHDFFWESSFVYGVFGSRRGLQANQGTVRKSAISPQPGNRKRIKWSNTSYLNKRSFMFKIKFCVFQGTTPSFCKKGSRILNAQPVKIPQFKSLLTRKQARWPHLFIAFFLMFISWMLIMPSFKNSLIGRGATTAVGQLQWSQS